MLKQLSAAQRPPHPSPEPPRLTARNRCGWSGLALGLVALALALVPAWIAPLYDAPATPIPQLATDWLGELKDRAVAAIRSEPPPLALPEHRNTWRDPRIGLSALVLAFGALVLGILAFVRYEDQRLVVCTVALGAGTICVQHVLTAVLILAFAVLAGVGVARSG